MKQIHLQELCTVRNIEQVLQVVRSVRNANMADSFLAKTVPGQRVYLREDLVPGRLTGNSASPPNIGERTQRGTHRPVSGSKRFGGRRSRQGRGDAGGIDKGSGTVARVTGGSRVSVISNPDLTLFDAER